MAFGDLNFATSEETTATTSHAVDLPSSVASEGKILLVVAFKQDPGSISFGTGGWTLNNSSDNDPVYLRQYSKESFASLRNTTETITTGNAVLSYAGTVSIEQADESDSEIASSGTGEPMDLGGSSWPLDPFGVDKVFIQFVAYSEPTGTLPTIGGSDWDANYTKIRENPNDGTNKFAFGMSATGLTTSDPEPSTGVTPNNSTIDWSAISLLYREGAFPNRIAVTLDDAVGVASGSEVKKGDVNATTTAGGGLPGPGDGESEIITFINAFTDAAGSVEQYPAASDINATTSASGVARGWHVSSATQVASTAFAGASMNASAVHAASMQAETEVSANVPAATLAGKCCCRDLTPECRLMNVRAGFYSSRIGSSEVWVPFEVQVVTAGVSPLFELIEVNTSEEGLEFETLIYSTTKYEYEDYTGWTGLGGTRTKRFELDLGKTYRFRVRGFDGCKDEKECVTYERNAQPLCDLGWYKEPEEFLRINTDLETRCYSQPEVEAAWSDAPTINIEIKGLTGPLAHLNGMYSVKSTSQQECVDAYLNRRICWAPAVGNYNLAVASLSISAIDFGNGSAQVNISCTHYWFAFGIPEDFACDGNGIFSLPEPDLFQSHGTVKSAEYNVVRERVIVTASDCSDRCQFGYGAVGGNDEIEVKHFRGLKNIVDRDTGSCASRVAFGKEFFIDHCARAEINFLAPS